MSRCLLVFSALLAAGTLLAPAAQGQTLAQTPAERVVAIAQQELAYKVKEIPKGSNRGPRIRMYGLSTQAPLRYYPAPWCAYFTSWVTQQAGVPIGWNGLGDGSVSGLRKWARKVGVWQKVPLAGDLIVFSQHIGIVESVQPNGLVTTIEGNTGDAVLRRLRLVKSAVGFIRVETLTPSVPVISGPAGAVYRTEPVTLTVKNVANPKRAIKLYQWDLNGDGKWDQKTTLGEIRLAFPENGIFPITVQLVDDHGVSGLATIEVTVVSRPAAAR